MEATAEEVLEMAKQLPRAERLRLVAELRRLDVNESTPEEIEAAWRDEIVRRIRRHQSGEAKSVDGEEMFARLRAKYASR